MVFKFNKIKSLEINNCILIIVSLTRLVVSVHLQIWWGGGVESKEVVLRCGNSIKLLFIMHVMYLLSLLAGFEAMSLWIHHLWRLHPKLDQSLNKEIDKKFSFEFEFAIGLQMVY